MISKKPPAGTTCVSFKAKEVTIVDKTRQQSEALLQRVWVEKCV